MTGSNERILSRQLTTKKESTTNTHTTLQQSTAEYLDSGTRAKVLPTHVSLLSAVTNKDCCSWVCAYCQVLLYSKDLKLTRPMRAAHWWPRPTSSTQMKQAMGSFLRPSLPIDS